MQMDVNGKLGYGIAGWIPIFFFFLRSILQPPNKFRITSITITVSGRKMSFVYPLHVF